MRAKASARTQLLVIGGLAAGWVVGLFSQRSIVESTGYLDISPGLLVLGCVLCALAGAAAHVLAPAHRRLRTGAIAGIAMAVSMIAGYAVLVVAYWDRFPADQGGETWWTLLLESWFWIGVPLIVSGILGIVGFAVTDAIDRAIHRPPPGAVSHPGSGPA